MPQFEVVNFAPQFVWLVIVFSILYFGIVRPTLPKLGRTVDSREKRKKDDVAAAERAKAEADRMVTDHEAEIAKAHEGARARVEEARSRANASIESKLAASKAVVERRLADAEAALAKSRADATARIEEIAAQAAGDIVEKLIGTRPESDAVGAAARAALV